MVNGKLWAEIDTDGLDKEKDPKSYYTCSFIKDIHLHSHTLQMFCLWKLQILSVFKIQSYFIFIF